MDNKADAHSISKEGILYIIFGILTTIVDWAVYIFLANVCNVNYLAATTISWVAAVLFAFITNKLVVFESRDMSPAVVLKELFIFTLARVSTYVITMVGMWLGVSILGFDELLVKAGVSVIVIIVNYIFSKFFIFKK